MKRVAGGRPIRPVQLVWLALAVLLTVVCSVVLGSQWHALTTPCSSTASCGATQLSRSSAQMLREHGISMTAFAAYIAIVLAIIWGLWYGIGALIITRKPDDRGAVVSAFFLLLFPAVLGSVLLPNSAPRVLAALLQLPGLVAFVLFCLLFPDGRFRPRWTRWLALAGVLLTLTIDTPLGWAEIPWLLILLVAIGVQVYRYRSISSWEQRQQTKWALFGIVVAIVGFVAIIVSYAFPWGYNGTVYAGFSTSLIAAVPTAIPISIGVAMLRSRLWDVDRLINRALVYLALTGSLAITYIGTILVLQLVLGRFISTGSALTVALSTLAIAALFGPMRRRIQIGIDRRFYRSKYNAERTLLLLGEQLRDEVDLSRLSIELTSVVRETLHPEHVSLWIRPREP